MATTLGAGQTVLNGGFEQVTGYPSQPGAIELATHWLNIGTVASAPDLFHVLGSDAGDLPETPIALVSPYQGMAIAGFSPYDAMNAGRRQYISGSFSDALTVGQRYLMTFQMTNGEITAVFGRGVGVEWHGDAVFGRPAATTREKHALTSRPNLFFLRFFTTGNGSRFHSILLPKSRGHILLGVCLETKLAT